jgi:hypothetical protein
MDIPPKALALMTAYVILDQIEIFAIEALASSGRLVGRCMIEKEVIPTLIDQNRSAQSRRPIDMMRQGWLVSLLQAWQQ